MTTLTIFIIALLIALPASAQTITVLNGTGELTRAGFKYRVGPGTVLRQGDIIKAFGELQVNGPFGAYVITTRGQIGLTYTVIKKCAVGRSVAIDNVVSFFSPFSASGRPFTCPSSIFRAIDMRTLANYRLKSAASFETVSDTTILTVAAGEVTASNVGVDVAVPAGYGNRTTEGQPPGPPMPIDYTLALSDLKVKKSALGLTLQGRLNPLNLLSIQGVSVPTNERGCFSATFRQPITNNQIEVAVASGNRKRVYPIPLPMGR